MRRIVFLLFILAAGRVAIRELLQGERRERLAHLPVTMMEMLPEDSPPKVMMSGLQRIQEQNEEILALLRER